MSQVFAAAVPMHVCSHFIIMKRSPADKKPAFREELGRMLGLWPRGGLTWGRMAH
jgi:hypothetical protein